MSKYKVWLLPSAFQLLSIIAQLNSGFPYQAKALSRERSSPVMLCQFIMAVGGWLKTCQSILLSSTSGVNGVLK